MPRYITFADVAARYPEIAKGKDATQVDGTYILYAEAEVDARLAPSFTVPFSSNNLTVKDLAIDITFLKIYMWKDPKKAAAINSYVCGRIDDLIAGNALMITTSQGTIDSSMGGSAFSTTMDYHPVHGMSDAIALTVSSQEIIDEENARGVF